jgi:hypothetical protein
MCLTTKNFALTAGKPLPTVPKGQAGSGTPPGDGSLDVSPESRGRGTPQNDGEQADVLHRIYEVLIAAAEAMGDDGCQPHGPGLRRSVSLSTRFLERNGALPWTRPHGPLSRPSCWQGCCLHYDKIPHR